MNDEREILSVIISETSIPLTEGSTKGNVNPQPTIPRPDFTPVGVGLPPTSNSPTSEPAPQPAPHNGNPNQ